MHSLPDIIAMNRKAASGDTSPSTMPREQHLRNVLNGYQTERHRLTARLGEVDAAIENLRVELEVLARTVSRAEA